MKPQVVVIHGGDPRQPHEKYLTELKSAEVEADDFKLSSDWKSGLQKVLGDEYEVFNPKMPIKENASYNEWKIWFDKMVPFLHDGVILIGHSLGAIFLAKYLSENIFPKKIRAVMLVATPYRHEDLGGFEFGSLKMFEKQPENIYLYHSKDDPVVDFTEMLQFKHDLPNAIVREFTDRKHIWQEEFPEIVSDILHL